MPHHSGLGTVSERRIHSATIAGPCEVDRHDQTGLAMAARLCGYLMVALATHAALAQTVAAQTATTQNPALDAAFQQLASLQPGQDLQGLAPIQQAVVQSHADQLVRQDLETRLIALMHGSATDLAKDYACRELALVGSDASIPVLAELLPNARLSHMARYALEGIGGPAVAKSLRDALEKTGGQQKVGIVISLGRLADADAASLIANLLSEEDPQILEPALVALGRIGNTRAAEALKQYAARAPAALNDSAIDAVLAAAESLCGQGEGAAAVAIYTSLQSADSERIRAAAYRGLITAQPADSATKILAGLSAGDPWQREVAADCLCDVTNSDTIGTIASAIPGLPVAGQVAAYASLKNRTQEAIRAAALMSLQQPSLEVRLAALEALIATATPEDVSLLAGVALTAETPAQREAAFETLRRMPANGTNGALIDLMDQSAEVHPTLVRCALARRGPEFIPTFLQAAQSANADTRLMAFSALEVMATDQEVEPLIRLLAKTAPGEEREAADRALWMSCQKIADPAARVAPLLAAMEHADKTGRCALLPSLARMGGEQPLGAVHVAMQSQDQEVRDAGYRALANWPDATVISELLDIAKTSDVPSYRIWSLRAYARLVSLPSERPVQETYEMLKNVLEMATRTEDQELIISRLGAVRTPEAASVVAPLPGPGGTASRGGASGFRVGERAQPIPSRPGACRVGESRFVNRRSGYSPADPQSAPRHRNSQTRTETIGGHGDDTLAQDALLTTGNAPAHRRRGRGVCRAARPSRLGIGPGRHHCTEQSHHGRLDRRGDDGTGTLPHFCAYEDVQLLALSDVDPWRRDNAAQTLEQAYSARQPSGQSHGFRAYNDFRELLDRDDIDAVIIATGERWHPAISVLAAKAGKDIYCEKPISLTIRQARTMAETVRRHNRVFQTGLQQRNGIEYNKAVEMVRAGRIGEVKLAYVSASDVSPYQNFPAQPIPDGLDWDMWLGPCPWHPYNYAYHHTGAPQHVVPWSCNRAFGAGGMTSGLVHNLDSAHEGLGKDGTGPVKITPAGVDGEPSLTFTYADGTRIVCATTLQEGQHVIPAGWDPKTSIVNFGVLFVGDKGWIHVERFGVLNCYPKYLLDVEVPKSHSVELNHRDWLDCIRTRRRPKADVEIGACSTILSHLGCIALWTGRALTWDPVREEFLNDREANALRSRATREPWSV